MSKRDKQKLRYLRRLRTFYNPIDEIFVDELDDISEEEEEEGAKIVPILPVKMASSQEVEALLKQYSKRKPKLNALEPTMFEGSMIRGLPEEIKYQIVTHNPQNLDETIQRIMLCESMTKTKEDATLCSIDERILSTKMDGFVNKLTSSLDAIEKNISTVP